MKKILFATLITLGLNLPVAFAEMVNINTADAKILQDNLKGIGEKKAEAIIVYRTEHGAFKTLEEIQEVKGIGKGLFEKLKTDISLTEGLGTNTSTTTNNAQTPVSPNTVKPAITADSKAETKPTSTPPAATPSTPAATKQADKKS